MLIIILSKKMTNISHFFSQNRFEIIKKYMKSVAKRISIKYNLYVVVRW